MGSGAPPDPAHPGGRQSEAEQRTAAARSAAKLTKALIALETYVSGLTDLIIDYASARLDDEPFFKLPTEGRGPMAAAPPSCFGWQRSFLRLQNGA
jgi:hypothetical protein